MPVPANVDYDIWLGPAPKRPFNRNRFHYNWHWNWDYGNGDLGNQGIHQMDLARWGLNKNELPKAVMASAAGSVTPTTARPPTRCSSALNLTTASSSSRCAGCPPTPNRQVKIGDIFYGTEGILAITSYSDWQIFLGPKLEPGPSGKAGGDHYANFVKAVKARDHKLLNADIEEGHLSSAYCHLGNIAYRLGRKLHVNPSTESFVNDSEADAMLTREYRAGFVVPDKV